MHPKAKPTVSPEAYERMQEGWNKAKKKPAAKKKKQ
jgi:hypothetical protein